MSLLDNRCGQETSKVSIDSRFLFPVVLCPEEVRGLASNYRPQYLKQVLSVASLSDVEMFIILRRGGNVGHFG